MNRKTLTWILPAIAMIATMAYCSSIASKGHKNSLVSRIESIVPVGKHREVPCAQVAANRPQVLLALGQSNAGNHGIPTAHAAEAVTLFADGKCIKATDPLPGGTGTGGSIWLRLPALLPMQKNARPIVLSVLAVDATSIDDWTNPGSPLRERLASHVASMRRADLAPALVIWQQGEADAQKGTSTDDYAEGLFKLMTILNEAGSNAPIILARSTKCRSPPSTAIRIAVAATVARDRRFRLGPDTDTLSGDTFRSGCHLTAEGLDSAAKMWAKTISNETSVFSLAP